jgi:hypothetical protein
MMMLVGLAAADTAAKGSRLTWGPYEFLEKGFRTAPWVKDPFFPEMNGLKLSGIISNEMAYINGQWFRRGDKVEGYLVREISGTQVTLTKRSEILVLKMEN